MSLTWARCRDNVTMALVLAGVLAAGSVALDVREIKVIVRSLDSRVERLEGSVDRHIEGHPSD